MPTAVEMTWVKNAVALSSLNAGTQALVNNILSGSNASNIRSGAGDANVEKFFNHAYNRDPANNGGALGGNVFVKIYYLPSTTREYDSYAVVDKAVGFWSGRRRLAVRRVGDELSFYTTNHPQDDARLRTNVYGVFTPIDPAR
jgi:hypothetical protein